MPNNPADVLASQGYFLAGLLDPSVMPIDAVRGTLYVRNSAGPLGVYQKNDDGLTTNWTVIGNSANFKITPLGGLAALYTNKSGGPSIKGRALCFHPLFDDSVYYPQSSLMRQSAIGVFLDDGVANNEPAWIVYSGPAELLLIEDTGAASGDWLSVVSNGNGWFAPLSTAPTTTLTARGVGYGRASQTVAAPGPGNYALVKAMTHFM